MEFSKINNNGNLFMKKNNCALFDLDGVIVNTAKYHYLAWKKTAKHLGYDLTPSDNEQLKGISRADSLDKIIEWSASKVSEQEYKDLMQAKNNDYLIYIESISNEDTLAGVQEALDFLQAHGIKIGLGSASKNALPILDKLNLTSYFQTIVDGNHVSRSKPDPEVFIKGCQALNARPEQTVVFEDATAGIAAAKKAGMTAVALGDKALFHQADFCYPDFTTIDAKELTKLFSINS